METGQITIIFYTLLTQILMSLKELPIDILIEQGILTVGESFLIMDICLLLMSQQNL